MGLTSQSVGRGAMDTKLEAFPKATEDYIVALVGNPNVGKSTVFNALTGMNQHTGNWPGKTVTLATGKYAYKGSGYILVDLPGTYSFLSKSQEEEVTTEFLLQHTAQCVAVICDGTCLERNLILVLQLMEVTQNIIVCVNLMDEVEKKHLKVDLKLLESLLGIPVVGVAAGRKQGLDTLKECIREVKDGFLCPRPNQDTQAITKQFWDPSISEEKADEIAQGFVKRAETIAAQVTTPEVSGYCKREERIDRFLSKPAAGFCLISLFLLGIFWLTIQGANYPSQLLQKGFDQLRVILENLLTRWSTPWWLKSCLLDGVYTTSARVVSVMLPPMAIFFPLFTLIEDFGFLPRIAFFMDSGFQKCGTCGKQALTMCMGFGCNAAGVVGCRIIDSPRERLIAILTNSLIPCNGRFPALILLITTFFAGEGQSLFSALILGLFLILSVAVTMGVSKILSSTILKGETSSFTLELPPFRKPKILEVLVRSVFDRTLYILGRAVMVAAPAGLVIWILTAVPTAQGNLLQSICSGLEPLGAALGMSGAILLGFLLGFPANELVIPVIILCLTSGNTLSGDMSTAQMGQTLLTHGWNGAMALSTAIFFLFHWPCSTTCLTIYKETKSLWWTLLAIVIPTGIGIILCGTIQLIRVVF